LVKKKKPVVTPGIYLAARKKAFLLFVPSAEVEADAEDADDADDADDAESWDADVCCEEAIDVLDFRGVGIEPEYADFSITEGRWWKWRFMR